MANKQRQNYRSLYRSFSVRVRIRIRHHRPHGPHQVDRSPDPTSLQRIAQVVPHALESSNAHASYPSIKPSQSVYRRISTSSSSIHIPQLEHHSGYASRARRMESPPAEQDRREYVQLDPLDRSHFIFSLNFLTTLVFLLSPSSP